MVMIETAWSEWSIETISLINLLLTGLSVLMALGGVEAHCCACIEESLRHQIPILPKCRAPFL